MWAVLIGALGAGASGYAAAAPESAMAATAPEITVRQVSYRAASFTVKVSGSDYFRFWLEYGTTPTYGTVCCDALQQPGNYALDIAFITLEPGTTYYLRGVTRDGIGCCGTRTDGPAVTFTTKPADPPSFTPVGTAWNDDCLCVNIQGGLFAGGAPTTLRFEYGTTPALGSSTQPQATPDVDPWGATAIAYGQIRDLARSTTYYWRGVVENSAGLTRSEIAAFTTGAAPQPLPPPPTTSQPPPPLPLPTSPPATPAPLPAPEPVAVATPAATATVGPSVVKRPTIVGKLRVGARLLGRAGRWSAGTRITSVRWRGCRSGSCVILGRRATITLLARHAGMRLRFEVDARKDGRTKTTTSGWSAPVRPRR